MTSYWLPIVCALGIRLFLFQPRVKRSVRRWARRWNPAAVWVRRPFDAGRYGLVPRAELSAEQAGPALPMYRIKEMQAIADAAWEGDWRAPASYLEAAGEDWDERWDRLEFLLQLLHNGEAWLDMWRKERPDSCDAATLRAEWLLRTAWQIRGHGFAHQVPADRMARFREMVPAAIDAAKEAALLAPEDPGPWVVMITGARAARYSHAQFRVLWKELVARAPFHYVGHWQALQFWCAKWAGSDDAMFQFAVETMHRAPAGSPLAGIYLHALAEHESRRGTGALPATAESKALLVQAAGLLGDMPENSEELVGAENSSVQVNCLQTVHSAARQRVVLNLFNSRAVALRAHSIFASPAPSPGDLQASGQHG